MARFLVSSALVLVTVVIAAGSRPLQSSKTPTAQQIVEAWFARLNALDETEKTIDTFVEMYAADALHSAPPASHQLGTVTFKGHDGIRKMVTDFVAAYEKPQYRVDAVTARERTVRLFNTVEGPWGGPSVAVEFVAVYTLRLNGKRYVCPGSAFFQIDGDRIRRLRIYMAAGELTEVEPEIRRRTP